jgi:hypothetical protein
MTVPHQELESFNGTLKAIDLELLPRSPISKHPLRTLRTVQAEEDLYRLEQHLPVIRCLDSDKGKRKEGTTNCE